MRGAIVGFEGGDVVVGMKPGVTGRLNALASEVEGGLDGVHEIEAVVRKEMARLRERLDEYYSEEGAQSRWRVCVTAGSYELTVRAVAVTNDGERKWKVRVTAVEGLGGIADEVATRAVTDELLTQLSRRRSLRVGKADGRWTLEDAEWIVEGAVSQRWKRAPVRVVVRLIEAGSGYTLWTVEKMVRLSRLTQAMVEVAMGVETAVAEATARLEE